MQPDYEFLLSTDTSCDVLRSQLKKDLISYIPLTFTIDGETFFDEFDSDEEYRQFYQKIRDGALPTTSQINPELHVAYFTELIEKGARNILHLTLSSGLSATYQSACSAAEEVLKSFPDAQIHIVDSRGATGVQGYLLDKAMQMRNLGRDAKTTADDLRAIIGNIQVWVMADNLSHLRRGGRISGAAAAIGTVLNIKPIFIFNKNGGLSVVHKAKGAKKAFAYFVDKLKQLCPDYKTAEIWVASADADENINDLLKILQGAGCVGTIKTGWIGPVIGSHTGAGTVGIIYEGKPRIL